MNRRNLLTAAVAGVTLPGAVAAGKGGQAASPDNELIAVCAEFDACERRTATIHGTGPDCVVDDDEADAVSAPFYDRMEVLLGRMDTLRAATPAGIQARAHCLAQHAGHGHYSFDGDTDKVGRLLHMLLRDAAALGGSLASIVASPDAELLEACASFDALERASIAMFDTLPDPDDAPECIAAGEEQKRIYARQEPLVACMVALQPKTLAGHAARARSLALWEGDNPSYDSEGELFSERLIGAIVRGLAV